MAENKKSFLMYADFIGTFEALSDPEAGKLIKHILRYVNDQNPACENRVIKIAFEPIKQQLKRDLVKYEKIRGKRSDAGKISAERKKQQNSTNSTSVESVEQTSTKSTDTDTVNVTVTAIKKGSAVEIFFKDLPNSQEFETICRLQGLTKEYLLTMIPEFKARGAEPSYPTFQRFATHFGNWVRANKASATNKPVTEAKSISSQLPK